MRKINYLDHLNRRYFKENKRQYTIIIISIFLTVFLLMSIFIIKDSFQHYNLLNAQYQFGEWEISYNDDLFDDKNEQTKMILNSINKKVYVKSHDFKTVNSPSNTFEIFRSISAFNTLLPLHIVDGSYPVDENEVIIDEVYAKKNILECNDLITFYDESNNFHNYKISGIFKHTKEYTVTTFYTIMNDTSNYDEVYATIENNSKTIANLQMIETIRTNNEIWRIKYLDDTLDNLTIIAILFIFTSSFLLLYNAYSIYLNKKHSFLIQLYTLGMTKKQQTLLLVKELFSFGLLSLILSIIIAYAIWYFIIYFANSFITNLLNLIIPFACYLAIQSWIIIISLVLILFILLVCTTFVKTKSTKIKKIKFKKIKLSLFPCAFRLGILDILRKRASLTIILSTLICIALFTGTHYLLNTWITIKNKDYNYENNVDINFSFYELTKDKFKKFHDEYVQFINNQDVKDSYISFQWQTNSVLENNTFVQINCIDDKKYEDYLTKYNITKQLPILVNHFNDSTNINTIPVTTQNDNIKIDVLSKFGDTLYSFDTQFILNEDIIVNIKNSDSLVLLIPYSQFESWLDQYSGGYISGEINLNSTNPDSTESHVTNVFSTNGDDYLYVQNLEDSYHHYYESILAVKLLLYTFICMIIFVCIITIANIIYQYQSNRKLDKKLFNTLGMTQKQWCLQTLAQSLLYSLIIIIIAVPLTFGIIFITYYTFFMESSIDLNFPYFTITACLIITLIVLFFLSSYYSKKN